LAPALYKVTEAVIVVAAFFYAHALAFGVVNQSPAGPFIVAAQVLGAINVFPGGR
jgi:hypothetical protein